ncbi:hypothetical protein [Candidatus Chlorohelix allophototropha]
MLAEKWHIPPWQVADRKPVATWKVVYRLLEMFLAQVQSEVGYG